MSLLGLLARRAAARACVAGEAGPAQAPRRAEDEHADVPSRDQDDAAPAPVREPPA